MAIFGLCGNLVDVTIMKIYKLFTLTVRTLISYILCLFVAIFCFLPALILVAILPEKQRRDSKLLFKFLHYTYYGLVRATLLPITIEGREHIPQQASIFIANHESSFDIPLLGMLMGGHPHVWYVLERFSRTPILGFFVRRMSISVNQACSMKASRALIQGIRLVNGQVRHTLMFPEGGRYVDGNIHDFFLGFAILAKKTGQPVVPVMMYNLGKIYPPKSILMRPHPIRVVIGKPFFYQDPETLEQFSQRVRQWFIEQQAQS